MKLLLPAPLDDRHLGPLSDLEAALQGEHAEEARDDALAKLDDLDARLRAQLARGVAHNDYVVLMAALDACQSGREVLIRVALKAI